MSSTVKRSISLPAELDAAIEAAAAISGESVSAWVSHALAARVVSDHRAHARQVADGASAVREWEAEHGAFTEAELAEGEAWYQRHFGDEGPGRIRRTA